MNADLWYKYDFCEEGGVAVGVTYVNCELCMQWVRNVLIWRQMTPFIFGVNYPNQVDWSFNSYLQVEGFRSNSMP